MISATFQRIKYIVGDYLTANVGLCLFNIVRFFTLDRTNTGFGDLGAFLMSPNLLIEQIIIPLVLLFIYYLSGYYNRPFQKSRLQELFTTFVSSLIAGLLIYFALLTNDQVKLRATNYELITALVLLIFAVTYVVRLSITVSALRQMRKRNWKFNTLIIGNTPVAHDVIDKLNDPKCSLGYNVVGFVDIPGEKSYKESGFKFDEIESICKRYEVRNIIIAPERDRDKRILSLLHRLYPLNIPLKILPDTFSILTSNIRLQNIYEEPYIDISSADISESTKNIKRLIDIISSGIALLLLSLPMIIVAFMIKRDSKGKVIYSQERIGYRQKPFNIYKFRTMREDAEQKGPQLSTENDSRITGIGRILRKYRIDELPQFWNVLKGDMSLVGPRPERAYYIDRILKEAPYYSLIHQVRPGITSWGMVKYGYASSVEEMVKRLKYDLIYLENISILVDFKIIIYTVKTVFCGLGK